MDDDLWSEAIEVARNRQTQLLTSELVPNMLVRRTKGTKIWRIMGCYTPDGFGLHIVTMVDEQGYDDVVLYELNGKMDDLEWLLLGWWH